jgi:peptidoglycan/xylan/chitin deacetylase (PgdA/CDA1 family)
VVTSAESLGARSQPAPLAWMQDAHYRRQILTALRAFITRTAGLAVAAGFATAALSSDAERSARLVFSEELRAGRVDERELDRPEVATAVAGWPVPSAPVRALQRLAMKRGDFDFETRNLGPFAAARRAVLGAEAPAPPRFLVRVDEFPLAGAFEESRRRDDDFARFHAILTEAGVPYLIAVSAGVARHYLDPSATATRRLSDRELTRLGELRRDGVAFALHGFDHRTRDVRARRRSELIGLGVQELAELLDHGSARLAEAGIHPRVFAPPFNRFEPGQYELLARRYDVVCGGPESVPLFGFHRTPLWRGAAIYMPAYAPFYGRSGGVAAAAERAIAARLGVWIPMVLHWSWEAEGDWTDLKRLAGRLAGYARRWDELTAV